MLPHTGMGKRLQIDSIEDGGKQGEKTRRHTGERKLATVRKHLLEGVPVSDICSGHELQPTVLYPQGNGEIDRWYRITQECVCSPDNIVSTAGCAASCAKVCTDLQYGGAAQRHRLRDSP